MDEEVKNLTGTVEVEDEQPHQEVIINKTTKIEGYSPKIELSHLIDQGDVEQVLTHPEFDKLPLESKVHGFVKSTTIKVQNIAEELPHLARHGSDFHAAYTSALQYMNYWMNLRDQVLKRFYERFPRRLDQKRVKVDF